MDLAGAVGVADGRKRGGEAADARARVRRGGCIRVELKTDARNERSRAAMAAMPAQFEGIHRQHRVLLDGSYRDSAWYSVLDREWPDVRATLRRRLAARV